MGHHRAEQHEVLRSAEREVGLVIPIESYPDAEKYRNLLDEDTFRLNVQIMRDLYYLYYLCATPEIRHLHQLDFLSFFSSMTVDNLLEASMVYARAEPFIDVHREDLETVQGTDQRAQSVAEFARFLGRSNGEVSGLAYSHRSLLVEVEAALSIEGISADEVGCIILDSHHDCYLNGQQPPYLDYTAANVSRLLAEMGLGNVAILGIPDLELSGIARISGALKDDENVRALDFIHSTGNIEVLNTGRAASSIRSLQYVLTEQVKKMKEKGVKHILISVDLDVLSMLNQGISTPEYSPHSLLFMLHTKEVDPEVPRIIAQVEGSLVTGRRSPESVRSLKRSIQQGRLPRSGLTHPRDTIVASGELLAAYTALIESLKSTQPNRLTYNADNMYKVLSQFYSDSAMGLLFRFAGLCKGTFSVSQVTRAISHVRELCESDQDLNWGIGRYKLNVSELQRSDSSGRTAIAVNKFVAAAMR